MKKIFLPLLTVLLFAACQNNATTPAEVQQDGPMGPVEIKIDPAQVKAASVKAKTTMEQLNKLMEELNAPAEAFTKDQKAQLDELRNEVSDVIAKQAEMVSGLESAESGGGIGSSESDEPAIPAPAVLKDYIESAEGYDEFIEDVRSRFEALKSGNTKDN